MSSLSSPDSNPFLDLNQQTFAELATFLDFAEGLTIGFVEINGAADADVLIEALKAHPTCVDLRFIVMNFSHQPDLHFLRDELVKRLVQVAPTPDQKTVIVLRGLESAIGTDGIGEYPPVLQDLNFVRDAYRTSVPYPILFVLPNYAITRVARYAPDFWAWRSGVFVFKTSTQTLETLRTETLETPRPTIPSEENKEQIQRLNQLLMEYRPSGHPITPENLAICADLYYKLGLAYLTQKQPDKAKAYFAEALKLATHRHDAPLQQTLHLALGDAFRQARQFESAIVEYTTSLEMAKTTNDQREIATALFSLGTVAMEQRQFEHANELYHQCLELEETLGDRYTQASTLHQLGYVAQEKREYEAAREYYQQALQIYLEYGDRYSQASTLQNLGIMAQEKREYEAACEYYQQALQI
jgi:tetratricopeptide (TPR) repeat protein